jgi:predicted transposase/invertase (TIGR01784 family)
MEAIRNKTPNEVTRNKLYSELLPVKVITIFDREFQGRSAMLSKAFKEKKDIVIHWDIVELESKSVPSKLLSWTFIMLPRFKAIANEFKQDFTENPLYAWLYFLTREDNEKVHVTEKLIANDDALADGYNRLCNLSEEEAKALELNMEKTDKVLEDIFLARADGVEEGKEVGREDSAKAMIAEGLDIELISKVTKLPKEYVEKLRDISRNE